MPSTFRHAGEVQDDEIEVPRSRKGLVIGLVAAMAVAGGAAAFIVNQRSQESAAQASSQPAPPSGAVETTAPPGAIPPVPAKVKISFASEPSGAAVVAKATGETLGTTPFEREFLQGRDQLGFLFRKASFEDEEGSFVPEGPGMLRVTLRAIPTKAQAIAAGEEASRRPTGTTAKPSSGRSSKSSRPRKVPGGSNRPVDEDAVLEPSFRF